jgi:hypothetical protein
VKRSVRVMLPWLALAAVGAGCDPVVDNAISALGPEAPGVRRGPLHRPGQPCLLCHDGALGDPQRFSVAGTVFQTTGARQAAANVTVNIVDVNGASAALSTNAAGNFYATPSQYDPTFPLRVSLASNGLTVQMETLVEGNGTVEPNGACASCHFDPAGPNSPGHVALTLDDGGLPP